MVSATSYHDWRFLLRLIQSDAAAVDVLEFLDFVEVNGFGPLDAIYPKIRGQLDPPPEYLATGAEVRRWRGLSDREQAHEIDGSMVLALDTPERKVRRLDSKRGQPRMRSPPTRLQQARSRDVDPEDLRGYRFGRTDATEGRTCPRRTPRRRTSRRRRT